VVMCIAFCGMFYAILATSLFGFAARFPPIYTQALMSGQGWAGLATTVTRAIVIAVFPKGERGIMDGSAMFFYIAAGISFVCMLSYFVLIRLPYTQHYLFASVDERQRLLQDSEDMERREIVEDQGESSVWVVLRKIALVGICVWGVFFFTFLSFPGLVTHLKPHSLSLSDDWFTMVLLIEFNVFDVIGRTLPGKVLLFGREKLWMASLARIAFFPLFLFCSKPLLFKNDWIVFTIMAFFAFTNGYVASLGMMYAPSYASTKSEGEKTGFIMTIFLNTGILIGSEVASLLANAKVGIN